MFMRLAAIILFLTGLLGFFACRKPASVPPERREWLCMGTIAAVQCVDHTQTEEVVNLTEPIFAGIEKELSAWQTNSCLNILNHSAGNGLAIPVSPSVFRVLQVAVEASEASGGAFNPLLGPLLHAWGFNGATTPLTPPDEVLLKALRPLTDWHAITCRVLPDGKTATVSLLRAGMSLDLGAIAKGFAVDQAWQCLLQAGYTNLLVDLGGNLRAIGEASPGRGGWRTAIRSPFDRTTIIGSFLMHHGEAVATSGNYERFVEINGIRHAHILDGRSGYPVHGMASVTVIAPDAMTADLLSTTLFILGPHQGLSLLHRYPGCDALWIPDTPDNPHLLSSPGFAERIATSIAPPFYLVPPHSNP